MSDYIVQLKDGKTVEITADDVLVGEPSGALQFLQVAQLGTNGFHDRCSLLVAFARGQWSEVCRADAAMVWRPPPTPPEPPFHVPFA